MGSDPFPRLHLSTVLHSRRYDQQKDQARYEICSLAEFFSTPRPCYQLLYSRREIVPIKNSITYNATTAARLASFEENLGHTARRVVPVPLRGAQSSAYTF